MQPKQLVVHIAEVKVAQESGMGRIAFHWKEAFERSGYEFVHIGPGEVGKLWHATSFPRAAYSAYLRLGKPADLFLVHEPASGAFVRRGVPAFVFSHGLERRGAQAMARFPEKPSLGRRLRSTITGPLWKRRSASCDRGLRNATAALLSNRDDAAFVRDYYGLPEARTFVFSNGVNHVNSDETVIAQEACILFLGSWLKRKGIDALAKAAQMLSDRQIRVKWVLAGTGFDERRVLADWPPELRGVTKVIPNFLQTEEVAIFSRCNIFVLPSVFEGQPLALLEAMSKGKCCISTNCCGQKDLITHGQNGLLHEPGDAMGLAALLEQTLKDSGLAVRLGRNALQSVADRNWDLVSSSMVSYVESVIQHAV